MATRARIEDFEPERVPAEARVDLGDIGAILARRWMSLVGWFVLVVGAAALYLAFATPIYRATTSILLDPRGGVSIATPDTNATRLSQDTNLIESQVRLVTSTAVLGRVVKDQNLAQDPEFSTPRGPGLSGLVGELRGYVGETAEKPAQTPPQTQAAREQSVLATLAEHVEVKRSERSLVLDLDVKSRDPAKAARLADAIAAAFVDDQLAAKARASGREGEHLDDKLRALEAGIRAGERKVEAFRAKNRILDVSNGQQGEQQLNEVNSQVVKAAQQATDARAKLAQVQRLASSGGPLDSLPEGLRSGVVTALRTQYADAQRRIDTLGTTLGARHPELLEAKNQIKGVQAQITAELRRIALGVRNDVEVANANEKAAERALDVKKKEIAATNAARVDLRTLERAVQTDRASYDRLLTADNTLQQESVPTPIARQLAPALLPLRPSSPNARAILLIALGLGLALGVAAALLGEQLARRRSGATGRAPAPTAVPEYGAPATWRPASEPATSASDRYVRRFGSADQGRPPAIAP